MCLWILGKNREQSVPLGFWTNNPNLPSGIWALPFLASWLVLQGYLGGSPTGKSLSIAPCRWPFQSPALWCLRTPSFLQTLLSPSVCGHWHSWPQCPGISLPASLWLSASRDLLPVSIRRPSLSSSESVNNGFTFLHQLFLSSTAWLMGPGKKKLYWALVVPSTAPHYLLQTSFWNLCPPQRFSRYLSRVSSGP